MTFMAMDHNTFAVRSWPHGVGRDQEAPGQIIHRWNYPIAVFVRELSHLCAPGFIMLLGLGLVLLVQSRHRKGWTDTTLMKHIISRGVVLFLVSNTLGFVITTGTAWLFNSVLVAIAVDYTIVGLLWLGLLRAEAVVSQALDKAFSDSVEVSDEEDAPLLLGRLLALDNRRNGLWNYFNSSTIAQYAGSVLLAVLIIITTWWNVWLDPNNGHCFPAETDSGAVPEDSPALLTDFFRFWFFSINRAHIVSVFPPLAWISPALVGVLYGRLVIARPRPLSANALAIVNTVIGFVLAVLFVLTRLLHFGNLTEDCLRIDGQPPLQPGQNQYLQSVAAFFYDSKYPPDAAFFFYSLSGNFFLMAILGVIPAAYSRKWLAPLLAYGQSALFFFVVHIFVLLGLGAIWVAVFGHDMDFDNDFFKGVHTGVDDWWGFWGNWVMTLGVMWPLCKRYALFKLTKGVDSLWRFF